MPQGAAGPESGVETPNLMTSCAGAFPGPRATSPATVTNAAQITERCDLIATPPRLDVRAAGRRGAGALPAEARLSMGVGSEGFAHADYRNVDRSCQGGTAVKGRTDATAGLDYTHAHADAREGDPVPEVRAGAGW